MNYSEYTTETPDYFFEPRLQHLRPSGPGGVSADAIPVLDNVISPIENLSSRAPMPTLPSPVEHLNLGRRDEVVDAQLPDVMCCGTVIPHNELRPIREMLGQHAAQRSRYGHGAGEGHGLRPDDERLSGTQGRHGAVAVSEPLYTADLYDQGFVSLSGVPSVYVGVYTDPVTGEEYDAYESALPPPDTDYESTVDAPGRNVKLAHLQGGWSDNTPRRTRVEVLEDDFHMQYDRSIGSFGTYDPSYYKEVIQHNSRFSYDDIHPDGERPMSLERSANTIGNQGTVNVRPLPYLTPTNRGKWSETTFRSGVDATTEGAGGGSSRVYAEYTTVPFERAENSRIDGGGPEAGGAYTGVMSAKSDFDVHPTQRSASEQYIPPTGPPAQTSVYGRHFFGTAETPTNHAGTEELNFSAFKTITSTHAAPRLQNQIVSAPLRQMGLTSTERSTFGGQYANYAPALMNQVPELPISKTGTTSTEADRGVFATSGYTAHVYSGAHMAMDKTKRQAMNTILTMDAGNQTAFPATGIYSRFNDKSGHLTDFLMPTKTLYGSDSVVVNRVEAHGESTNLSTKRQAGASMSRGVEANAHDTIVYGSVRRGKEQMVNARLGTVHASEATSGFGWGLRDDELVGR